MPRESFSLRLATTAAPGLVAGFLAAIPLVVSAFMAPVSPSNLASASHRPPDTIAFPSLGTAANVVVLGGAGVSCTSTAVTGPVSSKLTVSLSPTCTISGVIHQGDASAADAFAALVIAYGDFKAMVCPPANNLTGQALGSRTLKPGVYCFNSTADLTNGSLTLAGPSSAAWVFQIGSGFTAGSAQVILSGGGLACNVYWVTGTNATIGANTKFQGTILAGSSVTFTGDNSNLVGAALAKTAVTMTGTKISNCGGKGRK